MDGRKWVITAIITVAVLALVAMILGTVFTVKLVQAWGGCESDDTSLGSLGEIFDPQDAVEEPPVEAPMEEVVATIAPMEVGDVGTVALVVADGGTDNMRMLDRFAMTCEELGVPYNTYTCSGSAEEVMEVSIMMMESGVSGIVVPPLETEMARELCDIAQANEVVMITLDNGMDLYPPENTILHINNWGSGDDIAMFLLLTMSDMIDRSGKFGVLSASDSDPIYDAMERYMGVFDELKNTVWKASGSGEGTEKSVEESVLYMLERNDLDAIITTDPMATDVAARVIAEGGFDVKLIGFGYPSGVADYLNEGVVVCTDPFTTGELAARSLIGILSGQIGPNIGDCVALNTGYVFEIEMAEEGVLMLFPGPVIADTTNVHAYASLY